MTLWHRSIVWHLYFYGATASVAYSKESHEYIVRLKLQGQHPRELGRMEKASKGVPHTLHKTVRQWAEGRILRYAPFLRGKVKP